jgi:hypothetical protein
MARTTTANLPSQDAKNLAGKLSALTGADRLSADGIKAGTNQKVLTTAEKSDLDGVISAYGDAAAYLPTVVYEQTIANLGTTQITTINIPSGEKIVGFALNVESVITFSGGGATLTITVDDGSTVATVATGVSPVKNTKVNKVLATDLDAVTNIKLAANTGSFNSGSVKVLVLTQRMKQLADA